MSVIYRLDDEAGAGFVRVETERVEVGDQSRAVRTSGQCGVWRKRGSRGAP